MDIVITVIPPKKIFLRVVFVENNFQQYRDIINIKSIIYMDTIKYQGEYCFTVGAKNFVALLHNFG